MKTIAALLASTLFVLPAFAGGLAPAEPEPEIMAAAPVYVAPSADWTGFYAGAQLGYGDVNSTIGDAEAGLDGNGMLGGVHAGYRWDFGQFVAGAEVDYDAADIELGDGLGSLDSVARLKLTGGADLGRSLVYGTVGVASADATVEGVGLSDTGYFFGGGVDFAVNERWTVGGEVLQHQFDDFDGTGIDFDATTIKAKVALRF
jgi:outer membrane immunogenic protein